MMKKSEVSRLADARKNAETFEGGYVRALRDGDIPFSRSFTKLAYVS